MATIFMLDGFEHGRSNSGSTGIADAVSGSPVIATSPVRTGARALEISAAAISEVYGYTITAGNRVVTQSFYIRFATLPTVDVQLAHFLSTVNCYLWFLNANDKFGVSVTTSGAVEGGPTIQVDTWYRVTVECDTTTNTFAIRAIVDGGTEFSDSAASTAADITAARLGNTSSATFTAYYDDWLISVTDGDYEDISTWAGHSIESLIASSDGSHNIATAGDFDSFTTTAFDNSTTNGYTFIAHRPLQSANTAEQVIRQDLGGTSDYMEFGLENLSDNTLTVLGVRAYGVHTESATSGASLGEMRLLLSDNTEVLTTGSISVVNSTEDPNGTIFHRRRMTIAPSGGWDGTKVDGLKARVGFADGAPDVNFIDFMLEVLLQEAAAGGTTITVDTPGAVTLAGQAAGLITSIAPSAGALSLAGQSGIGMVHSQPLTAGALTLTGQSIGLKTSIGVTAGAVTLAGQALGLKTGIVTGPGAFTLTGADNITLVTTSGVTIVVDEPGHLALAGQTVGLKTSIGVTAGALTLTGQTVGLKFGIVPSIGQVTFAGQSVGLVTKIGVAAGALTLAGATDITLQAGGNVSVDVTTPGAITLAGQTVGLKIGVVPTAGALTLAGQSVGLKTSLAASAGALTLAGATNITLVATGNQVVSVTTQGQVTLAGQNVGLRFDVAVTAGAISLTGQTVFPGRVISVTSPGTLTFAGQSVSLKSVFTIEPGALILTGAADIFVIDSGANFGRPVLEPKAVLTAVEGKAQTTGLEGRAVLEEV